MRMVAIVAGLAVAGPAAAMPPFSRCGAEAYTVWHFGGGVIAWDGEAGRGWANCADRRAFVLPVRDASPARQARAEAVFATALTGGARLTMRQIAAQVRAADVPVRDMRLAAGTGLCDPATLAEATPAGH